MSNITSDVQPGQLASLTPPRTRGTELTEDELERFVQLKAQGFSTRKIAALYDVSHTSVWNYLRRPEVLQRLALYHDAQRIAIQSVILERTPKAISGAYDVVEHAEKHHDAKGTDAGTRAVLNLEKASASAAGENKRVEITGTGGQPIQIDVRALVAQVIARRDQ